MFGDNGGKKWGEVDEVTFQQSPREGRRWPFDKRPHS
jgi:hypothetical protein